MTLMRNNGDQSINYGKYYDKDAGEILLQIGLTKREYFAGLALQGLMAAEHQTVQDTEFDLTARIAIYYADALLKELE